MRFFARLIAPLYYGRALGHFARGRYNDVVRLLKKALELDPSFDENALYHSILGRSYLSLGRCDDALECLARAYEMFRIGPLRSGFDRRELLETARALASALREAGEIDHAREIVREAEEYAGRSGTTGA
jgi:tetratricopeptide (TPR) repeat protein